MTQFVISFCAGCILIGSLYIICPEGNISKTVKAVFSLVFLVIIISAANIPLKSIDFNFTPKNEAANFENMQISAAEYVFSYTLSQQEINFSKLQVYTDILEDGSIVITKVVIASNEPREKILKALGELKDNREVEIIDE
jgi:hypothetical protein